MVVKGSGNAVAGPGAYGNVFADGVGSVAAGGNITGNVMTSNRGGSSYQSNGVVTVETNDREIRITTKKDLPVFLNGTKIN